MTDISDKEKIIAEIEEQLVRIRQQCHGWLECQDGSYEMALHYAGYDKLAAQLAQLKRELACPTSQTK